MPGRDKVDLFDQKHPFRLIYGGGEDPILGVHTRIELLEYALDQVNWEKLKIFWTSLGGVDEGRTERIESRNSRSDFTELTWNRREEGVYLVCDGECSGIKFLRTFECKPEAYHELNRLKVIEYIDQQWRQTKAIEA